MTVRQKSTTVIYLKRLFRFLINKLLKEEVKSNYKREHTFT
ncbi:hypothetical protein AC5_2625 [Clostridium perfringens CPE str. F4969]|nr:hypothetical protein AC5_2625 [Clostridium perfringens CPE str. F4969]